MARGLDRSPEPLKSLITDFNTAAGAFAREAGNLELAIDELPRTLRAARPALGELNGRCRRCAGSRATCGRASRSRTRRST